jgi:hypothetical protein
MHGMSVGVLGKMPMNLVDLILTVCALSNPTDCRIEHVYYESQGASLFQCMMMAPIQIARWSESHPAVKVTRWKCAFPNDGRDI